MHPEQLRIYRTMKPERKLRIAQALYYSARELKSAGLRMQHPDWNEKTVQDKTREIFLYART